MRYISECQGEIQLINEISRHFLLLRIFILWRPFRFIPLNLNQEFGNELIRYTKLWRFIRFSCERECSISTFLGTLEFYMSLFPPQSTDLIPIDKERSRVSETDTEREREREGTKNKNISVFAYFPTDKETIIDWLDFFWCEFSI